MHTMTPNPRQLSSHNFGLNLRRKTFFSSFGTCPGSTNDVTQVDVHPGVAVDQPSIVGVAILQLYQLYGEKKRDGQGDSFNPHLLVHKMRILQTYHGMALCRPEQ